MSFPGAADANSNALLMAAGGAAMATLLADVFAAGMTFNIEPTIYIDGVGGMRHCDVVACTKSGPEVLTDF